MKFRTAIIAVPALISTLMAAQPAVDTLLFTITLNDDTTSIYGCQWNDRVSSTLAGPVLMAGKHLLFYSQHGYVLYNESGKLLDSYSLHRKNSIALKKGEPPMVLAYPLDSLTLIFYRKSSDGSSPSEIYLKKIFKKSLRRVSNTTYEIYRDIGSGQLFNLAANSITDEMGRRRFLMPLLVGYTALEGGTRWWSIDRMYTFTSPLIVEDKGVCTSFFPGLKSDQKSDVPAHQIEPLGAYQFQNRWYYFGIASSLGNMEDTYYQELVVCDQAGNLLYSSKIVKEEIGEALLQYVKANNTNYTVRRALRHVFVPAIDRQGDICYGMIDFENKNIKVYRRMFLRYRRESAPRLKDDVFNRADELAFTPLLLDCTESSGEGVLPEITRLTDDGFVALEKEDLKRNGYYVTVHRRTDETLKKKLSRTQERLSVNVQHAQDSIAKLISAWCPYSVALNHDKRGRLTFLYYGFRDELLSARVLSVTEKGDVFVRVDCEYWAEVVQFAPDGTFINRFTFNDQEYGNRKDLVVVGKNGNVAELDFESKGGTEQKFIWRMMSADNQHAID
jgi:hypothetical protein